MAPLILAALGAVTVYLVRKKSTKVKTGAEIVRPSQSLSSQFGRMSPERAKVHVHLMQHCIDPRKLKRAAALFGHEGLAEQAEMLLNKAREIHDMMHGAKEVVERCRTGDQHAMAVAKGIGDQARAGNPRAQISAVLIEQYSKNNPPPGIKKPSAPQAA